MGAEAAYIRKLYCQLTPRLRIWPAIKVHMIFPRISAAPRYPSMAALSCPLKLSFMMVTA